MKYPMEAPIDPIREEKEYIATQDYSTNLTIIKGQHLSNLRKC